MISSMVCCIAYWAMIPAAPASTAGLVSMVTASLGLTISRRPEILPFFISTARLTPTSEPFIIEAVDCFIAAADFSVSLTHRPDCTWQSVGAHLKGGGFSRGNEVTDLHAVPDEWTLQLRYGDVVALDVLQELRHGRLCDPVLRHVRWLPAQRGGSGAKSD